MSTPHPKYRPGTPQAELNIHPALVQSLLHQQHPDLADLPITFLQQGWDNTLFRLGQDLLIRLPRRAVAADLILNEQHWLPQIAANLPLPVPTPIRTGTPSDIYPWPWSILPWLPGTPAENTPPNPDQAEAFAAFLKALHQPAPSGAPHNPFRSVPLSQRTDAVESRLQRLESSTTLITPAIKTLWQQCIAVPIDTERTWIHGDLHARNILIDRGNISAIIDWGDMAAGDPATDLASIWAIFTQKEARRDFRSLLPHISQPTWQRAIGWAIFFGIMLLDAGLVDDPGHAKTGRLLLQRITDDLSNGHL